MKTRNTPEGRHGRSAKPKEEDRVCDLLVAVRDAQLAILDQLVEQTRLLRNLGQPKDE